MSTDRKIKRIDKAISKLNDHEVGHLIKTIQASNLIEGEKELVDLENLLFSFVRQSDISGTQNDYQGYASQVIETYMRYNGLRPYGCWQTKAIVDLRTSFISGEGVSISSENPKTSKWIKKFMNKNKLNGSIFSRMVKGTEMSGKMLMTAKWDKDGEYVRVVRVPFGGLDTEGGKKIAGVNYEVEVVNPFDPLSEMKVFKKTGTDRELFVSKNFIYIVTGGDDISLNNTNTKVGMVLTEIENYDKGLKDLRRTNYVVNRITPTFETKNRNESNQVRNELAQTKWGIGKGLITTAKFKYNVAASTAHDNILTELQANAKVIEAECNIPIHWIGHTELMANRSTAESLFEIIDNGTKVERVIWSESIKDLIIMAQTIAIDNGDPGINEVDEDFTVKLPLISFSKFKDNIQALSMAYGDKVLSKNNYMNFIPGIDPIQNKQDLEKEAKIEEEEFNKKSFSLDDVKNIDNKTKIDKDDKNER